jgi:hypothetical protein
MGILCLFFLPAVLQDGSLFCFMIKYIIEIKERDTPSENYGKTQQQGFFLFSQDILVLPKKPKIQQLLRERTSLGCYSSALYSFPDEKHSL